MSGSEDEQDGCTMQLKKANMTINNYKKTIRRLESALAKKEQNTRDLKFELSLKSSLFERIRKSNLKLKEMLKEERSHYNKEKEKFCIQMLENKKIIAALQASKGGFPSSFPMKNAPSYLTQGISSSKTSFHNNLFSEIAALRTENDRLRSLVSKSDERNYQLCYRFLRMKHNKELTWQKLREVDDEFLQALKNLMERFNELREEINLLLDQNAFVPKSTAQGKYLEISRTNCNLAYENSCLKLELQCLKKDIHDGLYGPSSSQEKLKSGNDVEEKNENEVTPFIMEEGEGESDSSGNTMSTTKTKRTIKAPSI